MTPSAGELMKNNPIPSKAIITETAVRRKENTENRNCRTSTSTVSSNTTGAAISFNNSPIGSAPFLIFLTIFYHAGAGATMLWVISKSYPGISGQFTKKAPLCGSKKLVLKPSKVYIQFTIMI